MCMLSGRIIVFCKVFAERSLCKWNNGEKDKREELCISQVAGRTYQAASNTEQERLPSGYNLQKFHLLSAETRAKTKLGKCLYTRAQITTQLGL